MIDRNRCKARLIVLGTVAIMQTAFVVFSRRISPYDVAGLYLPTLPLVCAFLVYFICVVDRT